MDLLVEMKKKNDRTDTDYSVHTFLVYYQISIFIFKFLYLITVFRFKLIMSIIFAKSYSTRYIMYSRMKENIFLYIVKGKYK